MQCFEVLNAMGLVLCIYILRSFPMQCCELLDAMGVPCLQSKGEAEALCAQLNMAGVS